MACHHYLCSATLHGNKQTDSNKHTCHGWLSVQGNTLTAQACTLFFQPDWRQETHLPRRNGLPGAPPLVQQLFEAGALAFHVGQQSVPAGILEVQ